MSNWFGGGGGGGVQPSGQQTSTTKLSNQQDRLLDMIMPALARYAKSPPILPGRDMVADPSWKTQLALDSAWDAARSQDALNRKALDTYGDLSKYMSPGSNPLLKPGQDYGRAEDMLLGGLMQPKSNPLLDVGGGGFDAAGRSLLTGRGGPITLDQTGQGLERTEQNLLSGQTGNPLAQSTRDLRGAENFLLNDVLNPRSNPFFEKHLEATTRPVMEQFRRQIMPGLRDSAITAGQYGSSRQGIAEGLAAQGAQQAIGDIAARMGSEAYGTGVQAAGQAYGQRLGAMGQALGEQTAAQSDAYRARLGEAGASERAQLGAMSDAYRSMLGARGDAFGQAVNAMSGAYDTRSGLLESGTRLGADTALRSLAITPQLLAGLTQPSATRASVGNTIDQQRQRVLDEDVYRRMYSQQAPFMAAQEIAAIINGLPGGTTINRGFTPSPQTNPLSTGLGLASAGAGLMGMLFPGMMPISQSASGLLMGGAGGLY